MLVRTALLGTVFTVVVIQMGLAAVVFGEDDHLVGYKVKDLNAVQPPGNYTMNTPFGTEVCTLKKAMFHLAPAEKNGGDDPRGGPVANFVCYKAKCTGPLPSTADLDDQFGAHALEIKKAKVVCVPAVDCDAPGVLVGGHCWYQSGDGESCDDACTAAGKTYDPATASYAGSGGTDANCSSVLAALSMMSPVTNNNCATLAPGLGCGQAWLWSLEYGDARRCTESTTTSSGSYDTPPDYFVRACACQ